MRGRRGRTAPGRAAVAPLAAGTSRPRYLRPREAPRPTFARLSPRRGAVRRRARPRPPRPPVRARSRMQCARATGRERLGGGGGAVAAALERRAERYLQPGRRLRRARPLRLAQPVPRRRSQRARPTSAQARNRSGVAGCLHERARHGRLRPLGNCAGANGSVAGNGKAVVPAAGAGKPPAAPRRQSATREQCSVGRTCREHIGVESGAGGHVAGHAERDDRQFLAGGRPRFAGRQRHRQQRQTQLERRRRRRGPGVRFGRTQQWRGSAGQRVRERDKVRRQ